MKKSLLAISLLVLAALLVTFRNIQSASSEAGSKRTGNPLRENESPPPHERVRRPRPQRLSLEESLPPGSRVVRSAGPPSSVTVTFALGPSVSAASVSVTAHGFSFEGPYKVSRPNSTMTAGEGAVLLISKDLKSFKMLASTLTAAPIKDGLMDEYAGKSRKSQTISTIPWADSPRSPRQMRRESSSR